MVTDKAMVTDALQAAAEAGWNACRRQVYLLSEDYIERTHPLKNGESAEGNFYRGQYDVAKSFAKAFNAFEARDCDYFQQIDFASLTLERGEAEPVAWHRTPRFVFHFSLGPDRPANATNNPDEWQPLYPTLSKRGEAEETPARMQSDAILELLDHPAPVQHLGGEKPFGHWVKHRLADGVFLPAVCYVPTGPDYTVVPLYTKPSDPELQSRIDQYSVIGEDWLLPRKAPAADFGKLYTHPLAKQFHEAIQSVDNLGCDSTAVVDQLHALSKAVEQEINRLTVSSDGDVTDDMLNEGQERMCQIASRTVFEDHIQAEIYKAMRAVDPAFRNPPPSPKERAAVSTPSPEGRL